MKRAWTFAAVVAGFTAVTALWAASFVLVAVVARKAVVYFGDSGAGAKLGDLGAVGDVFGAINALFSGLALAAIALTLWTESRSRREARKPLVLSGMETLDSIVVGCPVAADESFVVPMRISTSLANQTADAALNVYAAFRLQGRELKREFLAGPLLKGEPQVVEVVLTLAERDWTPLLDLFTQYLPARLEVAVSYKSLEEIDWTTAVSYELTARNDPRDLRMLNAIRSRQWELEEGWQANGEISIHCGVRRGSWTHRQGR